MTDEYLAWCQSYRVAAVPCCRRFGNVFEEIALGTFDLRYFDKEASYIRFSRKAFRLVGLHAYLISPTTHGVCQIGPNNLHKMAPISRSISKSAELCLQG